MPQTRSQKAAAAAGDFVAQAKASDECIVLKGWDHWLVTDADTVTTLQLRPSEYLTQGSKSIAPYWFVERLRNRAAISDFLRARTSIPVPVSRIETQDGGRMCLKTERVNNGITLLDFLLAKGNGPKRELAVRTVEKQLQEDIVPQLQALRSNTTGSVDPEIPFFPPFVVFGKDRRQWNRIVSETPEFVLCHTALDEQNIYIDPTTFKITAIDGWDCAGYFPLYFELPLLTLEAGADPFREAREQALAFFGLTQNDMRDDSRINPEAAQKLL
ncbi:hypothetical protein NQ176_g9975 [Zarea fungicola]|uniref:Uncharacterized protein n=1 Tax=Zarea fungicola TaxID=93591 RepID=A0ACC1MKJ6_9HYPO|nr:hypothetical protein NQ176_g9975 [Lecanicillium fungicola]